MENQDKKRELIIEAALKRFAHFGLSKTTMTEIAQDLNFSKALLYYYFPDKIQLYAAVMESLINKMSDIIQAEVAAASSVLESLYLYLEKRQQFVKTHYNLLSESQKSPEMPAPVKKMFEKALQAEKAFIVDVLAKAQQRGEIQQLEDIDLHAEIFLDAVTGIRLGMRQLQKFILPDTAEFDQILRKEKKLAAIFLQGLQ